MDEITENAQLDPTSGNIIRKTNNGLKECDYEAPQHSRLLTQDEIASLIVEAQAGE